MNWKYYIERGYDGSAHNMFRIDTKAKRFQIYSIWRSVWQNFHYEGAVRVIGTNPEEITEEEAFLEMV